MLKKLANGDYSLTITFWVFGLVGIFLFSIFANITHSGLLRTICPAGRICSQNIVLFVVMNWAAIMTGSGKLLSILMPHLLISSCFVCYMIILVRGLWKSADGYEGKKFWAWMAKLIIICLSVLSVKSII